jgi:hypothetical protein
MNGEARTTKSRVTAAPLLFLNLAFGFLSSFVIGHSSFGVGRGFTQVEMTRWI